MVETEDKSGRDRIREIYQVRPRCWVFQVERQEVLRGERPLGVGVGEDGVAVLWLVNWSTRCWMRNGSYLCSSKMCSASITPLIVGQRGTVVCVWWWGTSGTGAASPRRRALMMTLNVSACPVGCSQSRPLPIRSWQSALGA